MRGEQQGIIIAFVGRPFLAIGYDSRILLKAEIILFDFAGIAQQRGGKPARQRGLTYSFGSIQQDGLWYAPLLRHGEERVRDGGVTVEVFEHGGR